MWAVDLIEERRDGNELSKEEIEYIVTNYTNGKIPDYQVNALLMAIFYQDVTNEEITDLILATANSGDVIDLSFLEGIKVDKHSIGSAGDTTTSILALLVASVGVIVAEMSGRGLGYTGDILDRLEAIPEFQIELLDEAFVRIINESKVAVISQSGNLVPAGKELYALRDVTATVDSLPLIVSSVVSKKIAAGTDAIVLNATTGGGAFMGNIEDVRRLAETMIDIDELANRETVAVISDMSEPPSRAIGNSLEVVEATEALQGNGPEDLVEMYCALGSRMAILTGKAKTTDEARTLLQEALEPGKALAKFREIIQNQGGDPTIVEKPERILTTRYTMEFLTKQSGVVSKIVTNELGIAVTVLSTGCEAKEDDTDHVVGLRPYEETGNTMIKGGSLLTIYSNDEEISPAVELLYKNIETGESAMESVLIHDIIVE